MSKIDVSIIIVNYNAGEFLKNCISSIYSSISDKISFEVIVVDNASSDESLDRIKNQESRIKNLTVIKNGENFGFSRANNIGLKKAKGRYVLFLNPDTEVQKNTLEIMVGFMDENEKVGAATCFVKMPNGKLDDASHRGFPTPWNAFCYFSGIAKVFPNSGFFNGYNLGWKDLDRVHEIDALAGAFMLVRREAGEDVGWWDEKFFFYGEDLDFCYRLKEKGWKVYFVPDSWVLHHKGVTGGIRKESEHVTTADRETRLRATRERFEAMRIFYRKHYNNKYPHFITWGIMQAIAAKQRSALRSI